MLSEHLDQLSDRIDECKNKMQDVTIESIESIQSMEKVMKGHEEEWAKIDSGLSPAEKENYQTVAGKAREFINPQNNVMVKKLKNVTLQAGAGGENKDSRHEKTLERNSRKTN